jgi:hypothetical protein
VTDLAAIARRDKYLFVVFFLAVDYDGLMAKLPTGDGSMALWKSTGFFDKDLRPKRAWAHYCQAWLGRNAAPDTASSPQPRATSRSQEQTDAQSALGFNVAADLFVAPAGAISLVRDGNEPGRMRWKYTYQPGEFSWAVKDLPAGSAAGTGGFAFDLKMDRPEPLLIQVEETSGEAFYTMLQPKKNWTHYELPWSKFQLDPEKRRNGQLDRNQIKRIMLADGAAADRGLTGSRVVEVSRLHYLGR